MKKIYFAFIALCFITTSCNDFVDIIPKGNTIPTTVDDLAKMLNFGTYTSIGGFSTLNYNVDYFEVYTDDFTLPQDPGHPYYSMNSIAILANAMKWSDSEDAGDGNWTGLYKSNYLVNYVLDNIDNVEQGVAYERDEIKGRALVHRAMNYFILVNLYGKQYNATAGSTSSTDLGVPLVLESDINKQYPRATVASVYEQVLADLTEAISLLKIDAPKEKSIPGLASAYALRARVYLWMQNYDQAYNDAVSALAKLSQLIDYNTCSYTLPSYGAAAGINGYNTPAALNQEVMYARYKTATTPCLYGEKLLAITDTDNDLRYTLFRYIYGGITLMVYGYHYNSGINTSEVWLTKAEAALRKSSPNISDALAALNYVRKNRIKTSAYQPVTETNPTALLTQILNERRREIRMNDLAFFDHKRLNINPTTARTMSRMFLGEEYTLPVGDKRWQFLIPREVMQFNPQMVQNER